jgi:hypothetical protein
MWFPHDLQLMLHVPFLTPVNIRGELVAIPYPRAITQSKRAVGPTLCVRPSRSAAGRWLFFNELVRDQKPFHARGMQFCF